MSQPELSIIVPVYDNASTLGELLDRLLAVLEPMGRSFEIVCVDDGSRDASLAILEERAARDPRIRPFALVRHFGGQAAACAALDLARGTSIASLDADLENLPEDLPVLLAALDQGYDLVCGYRENRRAPLLTRRLPSALMNAFIRRRANTTIPDLGCGMRAMRAWVIHDLAAEGEARRMLTPLILRRARKVTAVPVRQGGAPRSSRHSFPSLLAIAADYYLATAGRPFLVSGVASALAVVAGLLLLPAGLSGLVVLVGGLLGGLLSLVGEFSQRTYELAQGKPLYRLRDPGRSEER